LDENRHAHCFRCFQQGPGLTEGDGEDGRVRLGLALQDSDSLDGFGESVSHVEWVESDMDAQVFGDRFQHFEDLRPVGVVFAGGREEGDARSTGALRRRGQAKRRQERKKKAWKEGGAFMGSSC